MLRSEITYAILELIRNGSIVDDDRLDLRLIEEFIRAKRVEFINQMVDSTKVLPEHFYQYITVTSKTELSAPDAEEKVYKLVDMPKVVFARSGPVIVEITSDDATYKSKALLDLPYKLVNPQAFKYAGNGRFNTKWVFATYKDDDLIIKSKNTLLPSVTRFLIKAAVENPEDVSGFDVETMDYPISKQGFDFIKTEVLTKDIRIFVSTTPDSTNNASGD